MEKGVALAASNLLYSIETCDDFIDVLANLDIQNEWEDSNLMKILSKAIEEACEYKKSLEKKLEEL